MFPSEAHASSSGTGRGPWLPDPSPPSRKTYQEPGLGSAQQSLPMGVDRDYQEQDQHRLYASGGSLDHRAPYLEQQVHPGISHSFPQISGNVAAPVESTPSGIVHPMQYPTDYRGVEHAQATSLYQMLDARPSHSSLSSLTQLRTDDFSAPLDASLLMAPNMTTPPEPNSATTASSSSHSSPGDDYWPTSSTQRKDTQPEAPRPRNSRREKPRIQLAADQPPTTQGKPRARVFVACIQCRNRKIRCDGAKPICHNCGHRVGGSNECNYDAAPKRRGPDKLPGARQRMARTVRDELEGEAVPRRRRRRKPGDTAPANTVLTSGEKSNQNETDRESQDLSESLPTLQSHDVVLPSSLHGTAPLQTVILSQGLVHGASGYSDTVAYPPTGGYLESVQRDDYPPHSLSQHTISYDSYADGYETHTSTVPQGTATSRGYLAEGDKEYDNESEDLVVDITAEPSLDFTRKTWWDSLLSLYTEPHSPHHLTLTTSQRDVAARAITSELRFLFRSSNYWFSFFHVPRFFSKIFDPVKRDRMQPSLVLALLGLATFFQSSEISRGREGRERAFKFRDEAQSALEASFNAGWVDDTLAQAAWLLAMFEICAHPKHSSARSTSSLVMLDNIIHSLSLTFLDLDDPHATVFEYHRVPSIAAPPQQYRHQTSWSHPNYLSHPDTQTALLTAQPSPGGCSCVTLSLAKHWPSAHEHTPLWLSTPAWDPAWSEGEIRKESCRRLCWSAMTLAAGHSSYTAAFKSDELDLFVINPSNYALLFPGEGLTYSPTFSNSAPHSGKETIWALYNRTMLLWHSCLRMRSDSLATDADKSQFGVGAWLEADALEDSLNRHTCGIERAFLFQGREYLFNVRMCISYEFQRYIPLATAAVDRLFHRKKAEEWLSLQANVGKRLMQGLHTVTGQATNVLSRRPFFVFWFMGQMSRALTLWACDHSLTVALDVCKVFLAPIDYLTALWPCPAQRARYEIIRERLSEACYISRLPSPPPMNLTLPDPSPQALV